MSDSPFTIQTASSTADLDAIRDLFQRYERAIGVDLCFQGFEAELAGLPGKYAPPGGDLLLAKNLDGHPIGCVAVRPAEPPQSCEMKRLFVDPSARGLGLGRALAEAIIQSAQNLGYREMRLDTLPQMSEAIRLYRSLGFVDIDAYYDTPHESTIFLCKSLV